MLASIRKAPPMTVKITPITPQPEGAVGLLEANCSDPHREEIGSNRPAPDSAPHPDRLLCLPLSSKVSIAFGPTTSTSRFPPQENLTDVGKLYAVRLPTDIQQLALRFVTLIRTENPGITKRMQELACDLKPCGSTRSISPAMRKSTPALLQKMLM